MGDFLTIRKRVGLKKFKENTKKKEEGIVSVSNLHSKK
jgi:hypothetical protein